MYALQCAGTCFLTKASWAWRERVMKKSDVMCPTCHAGFQRIELTSVKGPSGTFRCPICGRPIETLDGSKVVAYRLTVAPLTEA